MANSMSYNNIRTFEGSTTTQWDCQFLAPHTELNILDGKYPSVSDFDYSTNYDDFEVELGASGLAIPTMKIKNFVKELSLTFVETDDFFYTTYFNNFLDSLPISKGRALSPRNVDNYSIKFTINYYKKTGDFLMSHRFGIIPKNQIPYKGDNNFGLNTIPITFLVTSFSRLHK